MCRQRILRPNKRRETPSRNCLQSKLFFWVLCLLHPPLQFGLFYFFFGDLHRPDR